MAAMADPWDQLSVMSSSCQKSSEYLMARSDASTRRGKGSRTIRNGASQERGWGGRGRRGVFARMVQAVLNGKVMYAYVLNLLTRATSFHNK